MVNEREIWDGLTAAQRETLVMAYSGHRIGRGVANNGGRELHWRTFDNWRRDGILDQNGRITPLGRKVYLAGNPQQAALEAGQEGTAAEECAVLRSLLDDKDARIAALEAALREIIAGVPIEKPVEDSDYAWDSLKGGREKSIASAQFSYADELARWQVAQIARAALGDTAAKEDSRS